MSVRNNHWYNTNETRGYPLDESATSTSDQGKRLPANIISDINLRYPEILGPFAFLASVGVSPNLISVTLQSALNLTGDPGLNPLAVFSIARDELIEGRPYPLEAQAPGVGGWIVFGSGIQEEFTGRFSGPAQALLAPRAARAYRDFPVASLGKLASLNALAGIVRLQGIDPVEIVKDSREIDGIERDVIVIRLFQAGACAQLNPRSGGNQQAAIGLSPGFLKQKITERTPFSILVMVGHITFQGQIISIRYRMVLHDEIEGRLG